MKPATRSLLILLHRWTGIVFAVVFVVVGLTGSLLTFQWEIAQMTGSDALRVEPGNARTIDLYAVTRSLERHFPDGKLDYVQLNPAQPTFPLRASVGDASGAYESVYVNQYTGALIPDDGDRDFWSTTRLLHIALLTPPGLWVVFASGWVLILSSLAGLWLWSPRLKRPRLAWGVRFKAPLRMLLLDLHNATGVYLLIPMILIALTGATLILARMDPPPPTPNVDPAAIILPHSETVDDAIATLDGAYPGSRIRELRFPANDRPWYRFDVDSPAAGYVRTYADPSGRTLLLSLDESDGSWWAQLKGELGVALHEGYIAGDFGRWVVLVCGLTLTFGSLSGLWLWWVRRTRRRARVAAARPA